MKKSEFVVAFTLIFISRAGGAVVNINLAGFHDGILSVPENKETGEIQVELTESVTITQATVVCSSLETGPGLTAIEFFNSSAPTGTTRVDVTFRIISPGRPVTIQCSAQSEGSNNTQFTLSESKGNNGSLRVIKAPTVHVCPDVILVHKYLLKSTVQVQFSERIKEFVVKLNCSVVEPEPGGPAVLQLRFTEQSVPPDATTDQVTYEIVALGAPVQVVCSAQSTNLTSLPPPPPVPTPSTQILSSSVNHTAVMANFSGPSVNVSSSVTEGLTASFSVPSVNASSSVSGGGAKKRRRRSIFSSNRTVLQYQFNTSAGPPVTFALDVSPLRIIPTGGYIRELNGSFRAILVLDQPADNTVEVTCSLDTVLPGTELSNATELCSKIKLNDAAIQFKTNELFKNVNFILSGSPAWSTVRVTCCGRDTGLSRRYVNETAVALVWVEIRELQRVDWNSITSGQRKATLVSDIDLTCPCNLKENSCDRGCCCDKDCSDFETNSFTCTPGFFGGATSERPFEFSCQASWPDSSDWQPFLCVAINNSPFTGYFYNLTSPPLAQDSASFNTLAKKKKRESFTFMESDERRTAVSSGLYMVGTSVKTAANATDVSYARSTVGVLSLPQTVFNGLCSQDVPVRFLQQVSSRCVFELEESLCNSQSPWSALNYLLPIRLSRPACVLPPAVLAQGRLNVTGGPPELATTEVRYYCTDTTAFISAGSQESENSFTINSSSLFESMSHKSTDLTRCAFDDGETLPPAPVFNKTTRLCTNVVVKVEYEFEWRDTRIDAVKAQITLGNVQIPNVKTKTGLATSVDTINTISQSFSVKFINLPILNSSNVREAPFQRSGNPGYLLGRPVLSRLENSSGQVTAGKLQLWSPGPDSLCAGSNFTPVLYGEDAFSGCLLRLSFEDMRNCSHLREMVLTNQNRLIQATHVGRSGNANLSVLADWLPVVKEPISNNSESSGEEGTCPDIPSGLVIEMLVTEAGKYAGVPQMEIVGTRVKFHFRSWQFSCVSGVSCSAPNDTHADVTQLVLSPSATPAVAASSTILNTSHLPSSSVFNSNFVRTSLLPASSSSVINLNDVPPSLLPASSSSVIDSNYVPPSLLPASSSSVIDPNYVPPSLLPAASSSVIDPNYVPPSLLPAASSSVINPNVVHPSLSPAGSSSFFNPNVTHPSLLPAASSISNNVANVTLSSVSNPGALHLSSLPSTAPSSTTRSIVSSSVAGAASPKERARNYPPHFQYFMVTSSVVFIKVPSVKPQRVKRSVDQTGVCYRDVCKEELFYPLTEAYQGEPREKSLALSLLLIFLALVTFAVTRPWG